jgi:uncharacterized protein YggU (UPF0235/DUF167 family)
MSGKTENFYVYVKTLSRTSEIKQEDSLLKAYLKSVPIDGRANEELLYLLSRYFKVRRSDIRIKSGRSAKKKLIQIVRKGE